MKKYLFPLFLFFPWYLTAQPADSTSVAGQVDSLVQVAASLIGQRNFEAASVFIEKGKSLASENFGKNHPVYADCLFQEGRICHNDNRSEDAERIYLEVKTIREKTLGEDHLDYALVLNTLGKLYFRMGRYPEADSLYQIVGNLRADKLGKDHLEYAAILTDMGILYLRMNRFDDCEKVHNEAKAIRTEKLGTDHPDYIGTLNNMGSLFYWSGRYEEAEEYYLQVKKWREENFGKEHIQYAHILSNMANLYSDMNRYEEAERFYSEILKIQEKLLGKESEDYGWTLSYLGLMCMDLGRYEEAEKHLLEATTTLGNVFGHDHFEYALSLERLATLYHTLGFFGEASPLYQQAMDIQEKMLDGGHDDYANALTNLANLYVDMGKEDAAEPLYLRAKDIFGNIGKEAPGYVWALNNLAILYKNQGRYAPAENLLREAMQIREKTLGDGHPDYANALEDLALVFQKTNRLDEALELQTKAHQVFENSFGKKHVRFAQSAFLLASMFGEAGKPENAVPLYLESNVLHREDLARSARFLSQRELPRYIQQFEEYLDGFYAFSQKHSRAMPQLSDACFDNVLFHKGFILTAANQIGRLAQTDSVSLKKYEILKSYQRRIAQELAKPTGERQALEKLETTANTLEKELVRQVKNLGEVVRQVTVGEIQKQLKEGEVVIEFIDYQYGSSPDSIEYAALILTKNGFVENARSVFVPLCREKPLKSILQLDYKRKADFVHGLYSLDDRGAKPVGEKLPTLYDLIWAPIASVFRATGLTANGDKKTTIYFSPSGLLNRLNLGAIPIDEETVLGDQYNMVWLGSSRTLVQKNDQDIALRTAALFGGLEYGLDTLSLPATVPENPIPLLAMRNLDRAAIEGDSLSRGDHRGEWEFLTWSKKEVENIGNIIGKKGIMADVLTGYAGTEERLKSFGSGRPSPNTLHIATHGFFFPDPAGSQRSAVHSFQSELVFKLSDHPMMRSGLILSGGGYAWRIGKATSPEEEDGIVTAYEISQLDLSQTELVVLSACETGLGDIVGDEGVFGLQRAFKIAGARYLIVSLWQVPDRQTKDFMVTFYQYWIEEGLAIPDAFRAAQRDMKERFYDPYQWAGFVLVE